MKGKQKWYLSSNGANRHKIFVIHINQKDSSHINFKLCIIYQNFKNITKQIKVDYVTSTPSDKKTTKKQQQQTINLNN